MDKLTEKIAALPTDAHYISLEFFPPKTQQGFSNLNARLARMAHSLRPLFVNVTWGAGGSTSAKSLQLAEMTQRELGLTTCLHLTCTNMSRKLIDDALKQTKALGVRNILALRGDAPRSEEYRDDDSPDAAADDSNNDFTGAVDLVRYIRKQYGDYFCIGVAGYPEGHSDQSHPEHHSVEHDLPYLVEKTSAGADFIMTQLFYDVDAYQAYEKRLRAHESGVFRDIPIIPGLMPIQSYQILQRTIKLSHATLPAEILKRLDVVKGDDDTVKKVGVDVLSEIVEKLKSMSRKGPKGFHFYTLNLENVVAQIIERTGLIPPIIIGADVDDTATIAVQETDDHVADEAARKQQRRKSSMANAQARNRVIVPHARASSMSSSTRTRISLYEAPDDEAGVPMEKLADRANALAICEGERSLGKDATWDDFPNGRWGDARSPAYGEIDGYGVSLHVSVPEAKRLWGEPKTVADVSQSFRRHLEGLIDSTPWSEGPLQPETLTIKKELLALIDKGWWTVASQPAVAGVRSTDPVFGWGPKHGFVFQKPFVEFFIPPTDWQRLRPKLSDQAEITFFAGNAKGDFVSSSADSVNPVTWGTFNGKEIVTSTIIEAVSFRLWLEEAFGLWVEWQRVYKPGSESSKLLERIRKEYWLVTVVHHSFLEKGALWNDILAA